MNKFMHIHNKNGKYSRSSKILIYLTHTCAIYIYIYIYLMLGRTSQNNKGYENNKKYAAIHKTLK